MLLVRMAKVHAGRWLVRFLRHREVDADFFLVNHFSMGLRLRIFSHVLRLKRDKGEATRLATFLIHYQTRVGNGAVLAEYANQIFIGRLRVQIENRNHIRPVGSLLWQGRPAWLLLFIFRRAFAMIASIV